MALTESELQQAVTHLDEELSRIYREREPLLVQLAELRGPYEMPKPSRRTETQAKVGRCPRCSGRIEA